MKPSPFSSVRRSTRSPMPSAPRRAALDHAAGAAAASRHAIARAPPTPCRCRRPTATRSTVTLGTPPAWWNARPGELSISPSSAMSLSRRLRSILSWPESPNARAISRLPAGWSDEAMKSRICLRLGRPAERLRGIGLLCRRRDVGENGGCRKCRIVTLGQGWYHRANGSRSRMNLVIRQALTEAPGCRTALFTAAGCPCCRGG